MCALIKAWCWCFYNENVVLLTITKKYTLLSLIIFEIPLTLLLLVTNFDFVFRSGSCMPPLSVSVYLYYCW